MEGALEKEGEEELSGKMYADIVRMKDRERKMDEHFRKQEQEKDTIARKKKRLQIDPNKKNVYGTVYSQREQSLDTLRRGGKRSVGRNNEERAGIQYVKKKFKRS